MFAFETDILAHPGDLEERRALCRQLVGARRPLLLGAARRILRAKAFCQEWPGAPGVLEGAIALAASPGVWGGELFRERKCSPEAAPGRPPKVAPPSRRSMTPGRVPGGEERLTRDHRDGGSGDDGRASLPPGAPGEPRPAAVQRRDAPCDSVDRTGV